jgi:hypothetical protein
VVAHQGDELLDVLGCAAVVAADLLLQEAEQGGLVDRQRFGCQSDQDQPALVGEDGLSLPAGPATR